MRSSSKVSNATSRSSRRRLRPTGSRTRCTGTCLSPSSILRERLPTRARDSLILQVSKGLSQIVISKTAKRNDAALHGIPSPRRACPREESACASSTPSKDATRGTLALTIPRRSGTVRLAPAVVLHAFSSVLPEGPPRRAQSCALRSSIAPCDQNQNVIAKSKSEQRYITISPLRIHLPSAGRPVTRAQVAAQCGASRESQPQDMPANPHASTASPHAYAKRGDQREIQIAAASARGDRILRKRY